jgi:outer membrane protein
VASRDVGRAFLAAALLAGAARAGTVSAQTEADERPAPIECDLKACLELAFQRNPTLLAAEARVDSAKALVGVANAERYPWIDGIAEVSEVRGNQLGVLGGGAATAGAVLPFVEGTVWRAEVGATAPLFQNGYFITRENPAQKIAKLTVETETFNSKSTRTTVAMQVADAYFDVLKSAKARAVYAEYVKLVQTSADLAKAKFDQNLISRNDLLLAQVKVATAKRDASMTEITEQRSQRAFCTAVGRGGACEVHLLEPPPSPVSDKTPEEMIALALENDPSLKALEYSRKTQEESANEAASARYPSLSLDFAYVASDDFSPPVSQRWVGSAVLSVPIYDFGRTRERVAAAKAKETETLRTLEATKLQIAQEIHEKYFTLKEVDTEVELVAKQVEQAKEALRVKQGMFEQSLASISEVNEAQSDLLRLQLVQIGDQYEAAMARFVIEFLAAGG